MSLVLQTLIPPGFMSNKRTYVALSFLFNGCYHLWRRTSVHFVVCNSGPRHHESDFCLTLEDNLSSDTATLPPREIIDKMKENLLIEKDPQWYRFYGD